MLVLGGPHQVSARVRDEVMALGGRVAVNLTPTVSHLVALDTADTDIRYARTTHLLRLDPTTLEPCPAMDHKPAGSRDQHPDAVGSVDSVAFDPPIPEPSASAARILRRGEVTDLPEELTAWDLFVSWTLADPPLELDVVAFVADAEERVLSDEHFVFFNALETPGGEVRLEIETNGESRLAVDLDELSLPGVRVVVGASLAGDRTFGELGPVELTLRDRGRHPVGTDRRGRRDDREQSGAGGFLSTRRPVAFPRRRPGLRGTTGPLRHPPRGGHRPITRCQGRRCQSDGGPETFRSWAVGSSTGTIA